MIAEIFPSSLCVLCQGGIKYCLKVKGSGGHIGGRGHGIIMGEMSDVEIRREERGDDSRSLRGGRLVPSDYADKQTPMPFSTAERFDNETGYCMFILGDITVEV